MTDDCFCNWANKENVNNMCSFPSSDKGVVVFPQLSPNIALDHDWLNWLFYFPLSRVTRLRGAYISNYEDGGGEAQWTVELRTTLPILADFV